MYFVIYLFGIIIIITTDTTLDNCQVNKKKLPAINMILWHYYYYYYYYYYYIYF